MARGAWSVRVSKLICGRPAGVGERRAGSNASANRMPSGARAGMRTIVYAYTRQAGDWGGDVAAQPVPEVPMTSWL